MFVFHLINGVNVVISKPQAGLCIVFHDSLFFSLSNRIELQCFDTKHGT